MQRQPVCLARMLHASAGASGADAGRGLTLAAGRDDADVRRHARQPQQTRRHARVAVLIARWPSLPLTIGMAPRTGATDGRLLTTVHTAPRAHEPNTLSS